MADIEMLIGRTLSECEEIIKSNRILSTGTEITRIRPIIIEGEAMMVTMDHRLDRLNVEIAGGKVVKVLKTG